LFEVERRERAPSAARTGPCMTTLLGMLAGQTEIHGGLRAANDRRVAAQPLTPGGMDVRDGSLEFSPPASSSRSSIRRLLASWGSSHQSEHTSTNNKAAAPVTVAAQARAVT
jgi:hypothetical protein